MADRENAPPLLAGTGSDRVHLIIPVTSDRGLAGGFNANIGRATRRLVQRLEGEGKTVRLLPVGRKGADYLSREYRDRIVERIPGSAGKDVAFAAAEELGARVAAMLAAGEFDVATLVFNRFNNVMSQTPTEIQLVPLACRRTTTRSARTRPPTSSSLTRRPSSAACCRATFKSSSTAPCWRAPPASRVPA